MSFSGGNLMSLPELFTAELAYGRGGRVEFQLDPAFVAGAGWEAWPLSCLIGTPGQPAKLAVPAGQIDKDSATKIIGVDLLAADTVTLGVGTFIGQLFNDDGEGDLIGQFELVVADVVRAA